MGVPKHKKSGAADFSFTKVKRSARRALQNPTVLFFLGCAAFVGVKQWPLIKRKYSRFDSKKISKYNTTNVYFDQNSNLLSIYLAHGTSAQVTPLTTSKNHSLAQI